MEFAISLIVGLVVGGAIGALATWWISRARGGAVSVMQLKQENDKFRNEVTEHFVETARLINQMTDSYKEVFDHLSSGAERLVDDKKLAERLPPASGQEVRLGGFGAASPADSDGQSATRTGSDESVAVDSPSSAGTQQARKSDSGKSDSGDSDSGDSDSEKSGDGNNSGDGADDKSADRDPLKAASTAQSASSGSKEQGDGSAPGSNRTGDKPAKDRSAGADSEVPRSA